MLKLSVVSEGNITVEEVFCAVKMKSSLWERQLFPEIWAVQDKSSFILSPRSALKGGTQQSTNSLHVLVHDPLTANSEEAPALYKRTRPLINCSQWWAAGTERNNRCQSLLNAICHLSKFQITPQLRRKMKVRMLHEFDILINYFLRMKNWLIIHVTLEHFCVFWIAKCSYRVKIKVLNKERTCSDNFWCVRSWGNQCFVV